MPATLVVAFWMLVSAIGFAILMVIVRELSATMSVLVLNFWRNLFAVIMFAPWLIRYGPRVMKTNRLPLFTLRSALMVAASISLFYAFALIPLGEATAITFTSPLFATGLAIVMLNERIDRGRGLALAAGFLGVLIILRPGAEALSAGAIYAIAASLLFAFVIIMGKWLTETESPALVILMLSLLSLPISVVPALTVWDMPEGQEWLWVVGMGLAANINMYGLQRALHAGEASLTQIFDFIRLPVATIAAWLVFREAPDVWVWAGAAIICVAAVYATRRESRRSRS